MMKRMIASLLIFTQLAYAGRLQDADFKSEAELVAAGSSAAQLLNDTKVYVTANGLNKKLSTAITDGDIGGGGTSTDNKLTNPGFESGTTGWTESGGTFASTSTASEVFEGTKAVTWDSSSAGQTLTGTAITVGGFAGQNAELTCNVRVPSGTATHTLGVWDGTTLSSAVTITSSPGSTNYQATTINFVAPSSGTITARFTSVAANEPSISIDDCYIGKARNIGTVSQAQLVGTVVITGCTNAWSGTSTTYADFATQTGCTYATTGQALAPSTNIPAIRFSSLAPGDYRIEYEGELVSFTPTFISYFKFSDGTNSARETSIVENNTTTAAISSNGINQSISYSAPQSNVTLKLQYKVDSGGTARAEGRTARPGTIKLWYFPTQSQQAVSSAQTDYDWTSYGTTSDFTGFGTVSSIQLQQKRQGSDLLLRGKFTMGTTTATEARIALPAGLTSADTAKIPSIQIAGSGTKANITTTQYHILTEPSVTYMTIGLLSAGTAGLTKAIGTDVGTSGQILSFFARIPIQGWSENQRAPTLVGSVTSNASGALRIETATFTTGVSTSPTTQSSSWISSITATAGNSLVNFAPGTFSSAPTCFGTHGSTAVTTTAAAGIRVSNPTTTTVNVFTWFYDAASNGTSNTLVNLYCIGPR